VRWGSTSCQSGSPRTGVTRLLRQCEGGFAFQLAGDDGYVILSGGEFLTIEATQASIVVLRTNTPHDLHYIRFTKTDG